MLGFLVTVAGKIASLSVATQAAAGITLAVAGVGGVAAAGDLPAPAQNAVASAVSALTPFSLPHASQPSQSTSTVTPQTASTDPSTDASISPAPASATPSTPPQAAFGQSVSTDARSGGVDGQTISTEARSTHQPSPAAAPKPSQTSTASVAATSSASAAPVHGKPATAGTGRP